MKTRLDSVIKSLSVANAAIKNTASPVEKEGWFPTFSASGQDVWLPEYRFNLRGIVVSAVGARCGKAFKADGKWNVCANTHALSVDESIADRDYCWYMLNNEKWWIKGGTAQPFVKVKDSLKREHVFPTLSDQKRIVKQLDQICYVIELRQQQITALDDLIKARFVEMLKNEKTTPIKLKDIVEQNRIITYGMVKPGKDVPGGVIIIKVKDFPNGIVETGDFLHAEPLLEAKYERSRVKEGDLLYSIRGTVGRTAFVTKDLEGSNITQDTARLSIARDRYNANYIRYALGYDDVVRQIESQIKGVAMKGISLSELREIEIPCVKYDSQQAFGVFVEQVDKSKVAVQKALNEAQVLFDSLMQQYFG